MKTRQSLVCINKDPQSDWGASVPDLRGGVATEKTIGSALRRIERAIGMHLRGMREDGLKIQRPRHRAMTSRRTSGQVDFYATVEIRSFSDVRRGFAFRKEPVCDLRGSR